MKTFRYIFLGLLILQFSALKAQQHITVESIYGFPNQAYFDQQYTTLSVLLYNHDSSYFQGNVLIAFHTDSLNFGIDSSSFGGPYLINIPGDTLTSISIASFYFNPGSFKMGGNVVVVWPMTYNGSFIVAPDSFITYVDILGFSGISDLALSDNNNTVYPVPADDIIYLPENPDGEKIESVMIVDMFGRTRWLQNGYSPSISVAEFENGFYILEIKERSGKTKISKFSVNR